MNSITNVPHAAISPAKGTSDPQGATRFLKSATAEYNQLKYL